MNSPGIQSQPEWHLKSKDEQDWQFESIVVLGVVPSTAIRFSVVEIVVIGKGNLFVEPILWFAAPALASFISVVTTAGSTFATIVGFDLTEIGELIIVLAVVVYPMLGVLEVAVRGIPDALKIVPDAAPVG